MSCLLALIALAAPRFVIVLVVIFSDYIGDAYSSRLLPFLGFLFLPTTTLAWAWATHSTSGDVRGMPMLVVVLAVLIDLGIVGGARRESRK